MGCVMMPWTGVVQMKGVVENAVMEQGRPVAEIIVAKTDAMRQEMIVQIYAKG